MSNINTWGFNVNYSASTYSVDSLIVAAQHAYIHQNYGLFMYNYIVMCQGGGVSIKPVFRMPTRHTLAPLSPLNRWTILYTQKDWLNYCGQINIILLRQNESGMPQYCCMLGYPCTWLSWLTCRSPRSTRSVQWLANQWPLLVDLGVLKFFWQVWSVGRPEVVFARDPTSPARDNMHFHSFHVYVCPFDVVNQWLALTQIYRNAVTFELTSLCMIMIHWSKWWCSIVDVLYNWARGDSDLNTKQKHQNQLIPHVEIN